jgi:hypothetical protein
MGLQPPPPLPLWWRGFLCLCVWVLTIQTPAITVRTGGSRKSASTKPPPPEAPSRSGGGFSVVARPNRTKIQTSGAGAPLLPSFDGGGVSLPGHQAADTKNRADRNGRTRVGRSLDPGTELVRQAILLPLRFHVGTNFNVTQADQSRCVVAA